jgi:hypothetical protein
MYTKIAERLASETPHTIKEFLEFLTKEIIKKQTYPASLHQIQYDFYNTSMRLIYKEPPIEFRK